MADRGDLRWEEDSYSENQIAAVLRELGLDVDGETESVFLAYCPFHGNSDTPSFAVNKTDGTYICFNPACANSGNIMKLIKTLGNMNDFQAKRLLARTRKSHDNIEEELARLIEPVQEWKPYVHPNRPSYLAETRRDMWMYPDAQMYMRDRGFEKQTLKEFSIGYDSDLDMVCVPMHSPMGDIEVGAVRRSIEGKAFKNTPGLPTSRTLFNIHRAKKTGDAVIIVEASFDVMKLWQSGYPNAVAVLGGHFNQNHAQMLGKYFNTIVIMTDYDSKKDHVIKHCLKCKKEGSGLCKGHNPGEELGSRIAGMMSTKRVVWAHHGGATRFPDGAKDPGDMDEETIRYSIKNAITDFEYSLDV